MSDDTEAQIDAMLCDLADRFHLIPPEMDTIWCHPQVQGRVQAVVDAIAPDPSHFTVKGTPYVGPATVQAVDEDALKQMVSDAFIEE